MSNHVHYLHKCRECGDTIIQCICPSENKPITKKELCSKCKSHKAHNVHMARLRIEAKELR